MSNNEDIIIIENSDIEIIDNTLSSQKNDEILPPEKTDKKILIASVIGGILLLAIGGFIFSKLHRAPIEKKVAKQEEPPKPKEQKVEPSKLDNMIAKADYLYSKGSKEEALILYKDIATYSEAISAYNLGVAQLKEKNYKNAQNSFQRAIDNNENRCVSAINAAVCSLHLGDEKSFSYYINLADALLPYEYNSKLYSYYYSLIKFYKGEYLEALNSLNNKTTDEFHKDQSVLLAKINSLFNNDKSAIKALESDNVATHSFTLGMLYARNGDLSIAKDRLINSIKDNKQSEESQVGISYIDLKLGNVAEASKEIENALDLFSEKVFENYPIKVTLKSSLFNPEIAQTKYRDEITPSLDMIFQKLFYFSPYKVFNANQVLEQINKGSASIESQNIDEAKDLLQKGLNTSGVNKIMVSAIKKALNFDIREANEILAKLVLEQPKHSMLHYNLALTYAQLGNMLEANKHFTRSYNLDPKNYLSGIYALMSAKLIQKDSSKLASIINDSLNLEDDSDEMSMYRTLFHIANDDFIAASDFIDKDDGDDPLKITLDILIAQKLNINDLAILKSKKLIELLPKEIVPHAIYIDSKFNELKSKEWAFSVLNYLKEQKFNFRDLYYGPFLSRFIYTQLNLLTGKLYYLVTQLKQAQIDTPKPPSELTSSLAMALLYDGKFEEAFTQYNKVIDEDGIKDAQTLLLASVASVAANHTDNAIALLELSKLKEPTFLESRYALGLLHLEKKNYRGAISQFEKVTQKNFSSQYFDFTIDTDRLMFLKQYSKSN